MEKQGMVSRKRLFWPRLLVFLALIQLSPFGDLLLWADDGELLEVQVETSPSDPIINSPWSIYFFVKHSNPREVNVEPPRFPSSLVLERVRAEIRTTSQGERWTSVEFLFTPLRAETVFLDPFEISAPGGRAASDVITVSFREETGRKRYDPRFRWVGRAPSIVTGDKGELVLELVNWDPVRKTPQSFFQGKAPPNAILEESLPVSVGEGIYRYTISVIPLEGSAVKIESNSFNSDIYSLAIPEVNIQVLPVRQTSTVETIPDPVSQEEIPAGKKTEEKTRDESMVISFPAEREKTFFLFNREYNQVIARAEAFWDDHYRAESLAEIRRNERDSLFGPSMVPLRREIEQRLGLGFTENEKWQPLKIPLPVWIILGFFIFSLVVFLFALRPSKRLNWKNVNVTIRRRNGSITVLILIIVAVLIFFFTEESLGFFPVRRSGSAGKTAVLRSTDGYRIPDFKGAVSDHFDEGQPAIIGDYRGDWCFAETPDGRSGWVPRGSIVPY